MAYFSWLRLLLLVQLLLLFLVQLGLDLFPNSLSHHDGFAGGFLIWYGFEMLLVAVLAVLGCRLGGVMDGVVDGMDKCDGCGGEVE